MTHIPPPPHDLVDPTAIPEWERKLLEIAKQTLESERPPGQFFSTKSGVLSFNKIPLNNNEMNVVVTAYIFENVMYKEKFNSDKISAPICYAFGVGSDQGMAPHANAYDPQNVDCFTCPNNKWGSDPNGGKGKACKNLRRLCVIPAGNTNDPENVSKAVGGFLRIPVTSTKHWAEYVRSLSLARRTPLTVVTKIRLVPDAKTMHAFQFEFVSDITNDAVREKLVHRHEFDTLDLTTPYPAYDGEAPQQQPAAQAAQSQPSKFG